MKLEDYSPLYWFTKSSWHMHGARLLEGFKFSSWQRKFGNCIMQ